MPVVAIGADLVRKQFESMRTDLPHLQARLLQQVSQITINLLKSNSPKETGELANSWYEKSRTYDTVIISVPSSQTQKVKHIIFGTRAHVITPRKAKMLHWVDPDTGLDIYRKSVNHPGTKPNNFIASVLYTMSLNIEALMLKTLKSSHPYYHRLPSGQYYGFGNLVVPKGKGLKTPSDIVGLTGLKYVRRRGRGRSYIGRITLKGPKLTRRIGVGRRRT